MQSDNVRQRVNPVVTWVVIGVVVLAVVITGFFLLRGPGGGEFRKTGSDEAMKKVESGQKLYDPPAAALPSTVRRPGGGGGGGYSLPMAPPPGPTAPPAGK